MYSTPLSRALLALIAASMVSAQTYSDCNPVEGDECDPDPAFASEIEIDFTEGENDFFELADGTTLTYDDDMGAVFTCASETDAPTISSPEYIFFGEVEVEMMAAPGAGIITSIVLQSDCLDEIDWEWVGSTTDSVQTNYFSKGNTETYDRGGEHEISNAMSEFHTYKIVWTSESLTWMIDGESIRVLNYEDAADGTEYPQTPMQVKLGTWVAGTEDAAEGTIEWAGGIADFSDGESSAYYKRISVVDYAGGVDGAKSYVYTDETGTWESIYVDTESGDLEDQQEEDDDDEDSEDVDETSTTTASASSSSSTSTSNDDEEIDTSILDPDSAAAANTFTLACAVLSGAAMLLNIF